MPVWARRLASVSASREGRAGGGEGRFGAPDCAISWSTVRGLSLPAAGDALTSGVFPWAFSRAALGPNFQASRTGSRVTS